MNETTTNLNGHEVAKELAPLLHKLSAADASFARAVMFSTQQSGSTPGRAQALQKLLDRAKRDSPPEAPQASVGSFSGVYALFAKAREKLQRPKIRLQLPDGQPVVLTIAGPGSAQPGIINVTDGGGYPSNKWYGRVTTQGMWSKGKSVNDGDAGLILGLLTKLSEKPAQTASEYGRLTGHCCFCDRPLKDEQSTAAGFGPTCAKNFGLADERKEALPTLAEAAEAEQA